MLKGYRALSICTMLSDHHYLQWKSTVKIATISLVKKQICENLAPPTVKVKLHLCVKMKLHLQEESTQGLPM